MKLIVFLFTLVYATVVAGESIPSQEDLHSYTKSYFGAREMIKPLLMDKETIIDVLKSKYALTEAEMEGMDPEEKQLAIDKSEKIFNGDNWGSEYSGADDMQLVECLISTLNFTTNAIRFPFWQMIDNSAQD